MKFRIVYTVTRPCDCKNVGEAIANFRSIQDATVEYLYGGGGLRGETIKAVLEVSGDAGLTWEVVPT